MLWETSSDRCDRHHGRFSCLNPSYNPMGFSVQGNAFIVLVSDWSAAGRGQSHMECGLWPRYRHKTKKRGQRLLHRHSGRHHRRHRQLGWLHRGWVDWLDVTQIRLVNGVFTSARRINWPHANPSCLDDGQRAKRDKKGEKREKDIK